jgi:cobalt-precorrin 5A hydrolase
MELALWHVRETARPLAQELGRALDACVLPEERLGELGVASNREQFAAAFPKARAWILLMATGIATRYLAGLPQDKRSDPAVVVVDEACRFAIPVLGGHEGGGNALAYRIASLTGAVPVITTATEALKPLTLGIGLRRGLSAGRIDTAVEAALSAAGGSLAQVREVATVDLKAREPGLLEWIAARQLPLRVFPPHNFQTDRSRQGPRTGCAPTSVSPESANPARCWHPRAAACWSPSLPVQASPWRWSPTPPPAHPFFFPHERPT